jgi:hypothetical protein
MKRHLGLICVVLLQFVASDADRTQAQTAGPTDMTQLARLFPRHKGPTVLWVNFDGWRNYEGGKHSIQPFQATDNRDQEIQLILFRTAEIFAPFDVEVRRAVGNGKFDARPRGNTTIFVGANTAKVNAARGKFPNGYVPGKYADYPGVKRGDKHRPNSDPYDLGYVDPVGQRGKGWVNVEDDRVIAWSIAHEAGHTFGLVHTLTKPFREVMSYDAPTSYRFFANRTFVISDLNQTDDRGKVHTPWGLPSWRGTRIVTQNSFSYLWAVLGPRPADDGANVADSNAVDPSYQDSPARHVTPGSAVQGAIERYGDYDVLRARQAEGQRLTVQVRPLAGERLAVVLLVFDFSGRKLLGFDNARARGSHTAQVVLPPDAQAYKVVVGAADCASKGRYRMTVTTQKEQRSSGAR